MKKILIAMDSFKGTFSSYEINNLVKNALLENNQTLEIECVNIADGGEGSVEALIEAINGEIKHVKCMGPYEKQIDSYYGLGFYNGRKIALIEVASVVGFQYKVEDNNPGEVITIGIGELIHYAISHGAEDIYVCLGGSISNDGGAGVVNGLGVDFYDENGKRVWPVGNNLTKIKKIDISEISDKCKKANFYCLCDVTNPLYGPRGASYVFAKQKGAKDNELEILDNNLKYYHKLCVEQLGVNDNICEVPGTGAAGGITYSLYTFFDAKILSGIETILSMNNIEDKIKNSDIIITGEGKLDSQSFDGKVISEIKNVSSKYNKKLVGIFGCSEIEKLENMEIIPLFNLDENKEKTYLIDNTPKKIKEKIKDNLDRIIF